MRFLVFCLFFVCNLLIFSQQNQYTAQVELNYFKGNIAIHNPDILHLVKGHPEGFLLAVNKKTYGFKNWEQRFNYPDYGVSFAYQNLKNPVLGNLTAFYAHYNFYFLKRHLLFRVGQGLAHTNNPYDKVNNFRNIAYGSHLMSSTYVMINLKKERLFDNLGIQAGFTLIHYSNGNSKAPNTSTNTVALNLGMVYNLNPDVAYQNTLEANDKCFTQPLQYNLVFRSGFNESDIVGSGQFPFYIFSAYVDKRINRKSAFHIGADLFFSMFLKELIYYRSVAFPEEGVSGNEDYRRVGIFAGHEFFVNNLSLLTQAGYYAYYPYDFEGRTYFRIGLKHYISKKWFGVLSIKSHGAKAEAVELGVGIRL